LKANQGEKKMNKDIYQTITDRIIESLENGVGTLGQALGELWRTTQRSHRPRVFWNQYDSFGNVALCKPFMADLQPRQGQ